MSALHETWPVGTHVMVQLATIHGSYWTEGVVTEHKRSGLLVKTVDSGTVVVTRMSDIICA